MGVSQNATTSLRGMVKDPSGAVVPNATIELTEVTTGLKAKTTSNSVGEYTFPQLAPAKYEIHAIAAGFGTQVKAAELLVNQPATVDFTLTVQAVPEVVNVSAEAQTPNTT